MDQKHSGMGIAAFVLSLVAGVLMFLLIAIAGIMTASSPGGLDEHSPVAIIVGLGMMLLLGIDVVAIGLGIAGLIQRDRKRLFPILGLVFALATILGTIFLVILGNAM
ncbi:MAG TPA: hypothetical protein VFL63_12395 [Rhodanobacteraceae bacterium]|jgi:hypothetical protein|nr:hypothetical protein [Rhodanobacteraceae bacterium]